MEKIGVYTRLLRKEETMHKAIQSVLNQNFTDFRYYIRVSHNTYDAVNAYAEKDSRIEILYEEGQKGSFSYDSMFFAKKHEYICTVDADDWVAPDYLGLMFRYAKERNLDVVASGCMFTDDSEANHGLRRVNENHVVNKNELFANIPIYYQFFRPIWGKIWSSNIWEDEMAIPTGNEYGGYGGDTLACFFLLKRANKIGLINNVLYFYRLNQAEGGSKVLNEGRLKSDEALFIYVESILKENEVLTPSNYLFLILVYRSAVRDTLNLLANANISDEKRLEGFKEVLFCSKTVELLGIEENANQNDLIKREFEPKKKYAEIVFSSMLNIEKIVPPLIKGYYHIFIYLFPEYTGKLTEEMFKILTSNVENFENCAGGQLNVLCARLLSELNVYTDEQKKEILTFIDKIACNSLLSSIIYDAGFVCRNKELVWSILVSNHEKALQICKKALLAEQIDYVTILDLYITVSAIENDAVNFIEGKKMKYNYFLKRGDEYNARIEFDDLAEMGIQL